MVFIGVTIESDRESKDYSGVETNYSPVGEAKL